MKITGNSTHYWNYFLAIERDLENISRYIEFTDDNLDTYSIELARILLSASSEIDVIMKQLCGFLSSIRVKNIEDYHSVIKTHLNTFIEEEVSISRFGMSFKPWKEWATNQNPNWWKSYNNVKHQRNNHFNEANLINTINAVGALFLTVIYYYKYHFSIETNGEVEFRDITRRLEPDASLMKINAKGYYYFNLIVGG